ncbi:DUF4169 family protein [Pseudaminobacter sp. 19-2017]|uniref:DUF4169 family protein n=1 Tax=Pseudaminobacter soli (ex Zhang et al. 2022) TaxID=2831468 RepID=A0A942I484_9HYPH|nr:DUF4169 family protein [Pseudaminobacter soli]MBS3652472.1 DUF4169 family protein [Pseudaminobacter soli]
MGDLVNLRAARKSKAREEAARTADENRSKFGRTGAEKKRDRQATETLRHHLDAHRRGGDDAEK